VKSGEWYEHSHLGGNFRLNALAASMLYPQIGSIANDMKSRDQNKEKLDEAIGQIDGISSVSSYEGSTRLAHHLYITLYDKTHFNDIPREAFFKAMQAEGVYTYMGYSPLYREKLFITNADEYPWLKEKDYQSLSMPVTELIADEQAVWLRQNHLLGTERDIQDIIDAFVKVTSALKNNPELFNS
jgi:dTDP-4-amino-4,6-dideoxygalactose transaminase